jgi:predicted metal-dependent hydrolase
VESVSKAIRRRLRTRHTVNRVCRVTFCFTLLVARCSFLPVSKKSGAIAAIIDQFRGQEMDEHYLGYFECFNRQLYFEAHDVLEELWLSDRTGPNYSFHKGMIQLAGAFVHLQKNRLRPAAALFKLAGANLEKYPAVHEKLAVAEVLELIQSWLLKLEAGGFETNPLSPGKEPVLKLLA